MADVIVLDSQMETTWTTCKPKRRDLAVWFSVTSALSTFLIVLFMWIDTRVSILLLLALLIVATSCGSVLLRARFRYNNRVSANNTRIAKMTPITFRARPRRGVSGSVLRSF